MPTQNGSSNGVNNSNHRGADDFDNIGGTSPQMIMLDETTAANGRRNSRDSLTSDGRDNPAFEADQEHVTNGKAAEKNGVKMNGENGTNGHHHQNQKDTPKNLSKANEAANGDNVEMVPLNPAANNHHNNHKSPTGGGKSSTNGSSNKANLKESKLDMPNNDYFRPVNNKRKLFRGQKLYVTSDQRTNGRRWKWIAFWGGVFTFVAAALLTGILAATGIIMSKSTPSYGPPNGLFGNFSSNESFSGLEGFNDTNSSVNNESVHVEDHLTATPKIAVATTAATNLTSEILPFDTTNFDFTNHFDPVTTMVSTPSPPHVDVLSPSTSTSHLEVVSSSSTTVVPFALLPTLVSNTTSVDQANDSTVNVPNMDGRGRSLDKEVTVMPVDNTPLFPAIENIPFDDDNVTTSVLPNTSEPSVHPDLNLFNITNFESESQPTPAERPVTTISPVAEVITVNSTPSISSPTEAAPTPTISLWNESVLNETPDLFEDFETGVSNDSLSTNAPEVLTAKSDDAVNTTEATHSGTTDSPSLEPNVRVGDREEPHFQVNSSSSTPVYEENSNKTVTALTTAMPHLETTNHSFSSEPTQVEAELANRTETVTSEQTLPTFATFNASSSDGVDKNSSLLHPTRLPNTTTTSVTDLVNNSDSLSHTPENVTEAAGTTLSRANIHSTTPATLSFNETEVENVANNTLSANEQENDTEATTTL